MLLTGMISRFPFLTENIFLISFFSCVSLCFSWSQSILSDLWSCFQYLFAHFLHSSVIVSPPTLMLFKLMCCRVYTLYLNQEKKKKWNYTGKMWRHGTDHTVHLVPPLISVHALMLIKVQGYFLYCSLYHALLH